jgi:hypothetical protein
MVHPPRFWTPVSAFSSESENTFIVSRNQTRDEKWHPNQSSIRWRGFPILSVFSSTCSSVTQKSSEIARPNPNSQIWKERVSVCRANQFTVQNPRSDESEHSPNIITEQPTVKAQKKLRRYAVKSDSAVQWQTLIPTIPSWKYFLNLTKSSVQILSLSSRISVSNQSVATRTWGRE